MAAITHKNVRIRHENNMHVHVVACYQYQARITGSKSGWRGLDFDCVL